MIWFNLKLNFIWIELQLAHFMFLINLFGPSDILSESIILTYRQRKGKWWRPFSNIFLIYQARLNFYRISISDRSVYFRCCKMNTEPDNGSGNARKQAPKPPGYHNFSQVRSQLLVGALTPYFARSAALTCRYYLFFPLLNVEFNDPDRSDF